MPLNLTTLHMIRLGFMRWKFNMIKLKYKVMQHALKVFKTPGGARDGTMKGTPSLQLPHADKS